MANTGAAQHSDALMSAKTDAAAHRLPPPEGGWIDLHCHTLPGLDDGAADIATSLAMVRMAAAAGTGVLAATAHFPWNGDHRLAEYRRGLAQLTAAVGLEDLSVSIVPNGDLRLTAELLEELRSGMVPRIDGTRYFLLEFDHHFVPSTAPLFVERARREGFIPILTHPERNIAFQNRPNRLDPLIRAGALAQITAASLTGRFGAAARHLGRLYLQHGFAHLIASDAHGLRDRTPDMTPGLEEAARFAGEEAACRFGHGTPALILRDEEINPEPPARLRRKFRVGPWT